MCIFAGNIKREKLQTFKRRISIVLIVSVLLFCNKIINAQDYSEISFGTSVGP